MVQKLEEKKGLLREPSLRGVVKVLFYDIITYTFLAPVDCIYVFVVWREPPRPLRFVLEASTYFSLVILSTILSALDSLPSISQRVIHIESRLDYLINLNSIF